MEDQEQEENKMDVITVDVPLFIRLLEFAREDATDDMKLHDVAEKLIEMCADGDIMTMEQYDEIVGSQENGADTSGMNAVEDNMHPQNKDMNAINEQRWMKLAGIINEGEFKQLNENDDLLPLLQRYVGASYDADQGWGEDADIAEKDIETIEDTVTKLKGEKYFDILDRFAGLVVYDNEYAGEEESMEISGHLDDLARQLGYTSNQLRGL